ncbi:MAG: F0F1 ATP synthase subunit epsilon [Patescibacteria group bacterium]
MRVIIAKVHENLFDGEALSVSLPTVEGMVTILPHHEPYVVLLKKGVATIRTESGNSEFSVEDGVLEVSSNEAVVLL